MPVSQVFQVSGDIFNLVGVLPLAKTSCVAGDLVTLFP